MIVLRYGSSLVHCWGYTTITFIHSQLHTHKKNKNKKTFDGWCLFVLSRKAENQSYQATIQTDVQNEPNSCKITKAGPPASEMSSVHEKNSRGYVSK